MTLVVEARDLGRWYGDVVGVSDVTLAIEGGIVGLLGANGAGKSTFLKLLVGELRPSRGSIRVLGEEPFANARLYRRLGFAPQQDALWGDMTARETLEFLLRVSGSSKADAHARARRALERVKLVDAAERRVAGFSKGMRQRVRIAQAIAHDPAFVVLDEPLNGLDAPTTVVIKEVLRAWADRGGAVLYTSHLLDVAERVCDRIAILDHGRLVAVGSLDELRTQAHGGATLEQVFSALTRAEDPRERARRILG